MRSIASYILASLFAITMCAIACKKSNDSINEPHQKSAYYVGAVELTGDTSFTPGMSARVETVGLELVEDSKLKAELMAYQSINGVAYYMVKMTNKQDCEMILRWNWDELGVTSIEPTDSTTHTDLSDVLKPNEVKTYIVTGLPKLGRIKVQGQHLNSTCPNSSTLILDITINILPIKYYVHTAAYNKENHSTLISVDVDDPTIIDYFILQKQQGSEPRQVIGTQKCDKVRKHWEFLVWDSEK